MVAPDLRLATTYDELCVTRVGSDAFNDIITLYIECWRRFSCSADIDTISHTNKTEIPEVRKRDSRSE